MTVPEGLTSALLSEAWEALGGEPALLELVELDGDAGGLLPSTLPALPAMVAAVCASTLAASVLDSARSGRPPETVRVSIEHVALAARSERHARAEGAERPNLFAPLSRFWRTADGWMRLHANYAWHRERAIAVLDCGERPEDVGARPGCWRWRASHVGSRRVRRASRSPRPPAG
jgi:hypothetical protein